ncbi:MAG: iron-sulfur cluster assembly scaffold protein [Planctomycetota bacterium]
MDDDAVLERILDHASRPRKKGRLEPADLVQPGGNPGCGDVLVWMWRLDPDDRIVELGWEGHGCNLSMAGASLLSERLAGKSLQEVIALPHDMLIGLLGGRLALTRPLCSSLALNTAKTAAHRLLRERGRPVKD